VRFTTGGSGFNFRETGKSSIDRRVGVGKNESDGGVFFFLCFCGVLGGGCLVGGFWGFVVLGWRGGGKDQGLDWEAAVQGSKVLVKWHPKHYKGRKKAKIYPLIKESQRWL